MSNQTGMPPASGFNLPPSVSLRDIDPPCCPNCEGSGEFPEGQICKACGGVGVVELEERDYDEGE